MKTKGDGDQAIELLLRRPLGAGTDPAPTGECLDAETLAAWADGGLSRLARSRAEAHASSCPRCQAMVAALVRTSPLPPSSATGWLRGRAGWLIPLTAGALAVLIWFVVPNGDRVEPSRQVANRTNDGAPVAEPVAPAQPTSPARRAAPPAQPAPTTAPPAATDNILQKAAPELANARPAAPAPPASAQATATAGGAAPQAPTQAKEANSPARTMAAERAASDATASAAKAAEPAQERQREQKPRDERAKNEAFSQGGSARRADSPGGSEVASPGATVRWRIGAVGTIQRSTDRGASWETVPSGVTADLTAGAAPTADVCWLVGRGGTILMTTDGYRFTRVSFPFSTDLAGVSASDARTAVVTTANGRRYRTTDGGNTWAESR